MNALGFTKSLAMTMLSEVCDRMFCIAANKLLNFLFVIVIEILAKTVISAMVAWAALSLLPKKWSHHVTTFLFFLFAPRSLWEGFTKDDDDNEELEEVEKEWMMMTWRKNRSLSPTFHLSFSRGQVLWTVAAVIGRKSLASRISERLVTLLGGFLFLVFGVQSLLSPS